MTCLTQSLLLAQNGDAGAAAAAAMATIMMVLMVVSVISLAFTILMIAALWKVFTKAGKPGWAAIIPIYNAIVILEIAGKPAWWVVLLIIPFVNLVVSILVCIELAAAFGKGAGFGIGLALLGFIFMPILGFGDAQYRGPQTQPSY